MDPEHSGPEMKARSTSGGASRFVLDAEARLREDPFFYGYRWVGDEQVPFTEAVSILEAQTGGDETHVEAINTLRNLNEHGLFDDMPFDKVWALLQATARSAGEAPGS